MSQLKIFTNPEFGEIRVVEINGEPWFVGKDVAQALGYTNHRKALADHVDAEDTPEPEGSGPVTIIIESPTEDLWVAIPVEGAPEN